MLGHGQLVTPGHGGRGAVPTSLTVAVIGAAGYTGGEVCQLLLGHPYVGEILPTSRSDLAFDQTHPNLRGCGLVYRTADEALAARPDVAFLSRRPGRLCMRRHSSWAPVPGSSISAPTSGSPIPTSTSASTVASIWHQICRGKRRTGSPNLIVRRSPPLGWSRIRAAT